jgi:radical SAM protein with 4Fe4S-binding SPASM domain
MPKTLAQRINLRASAKNIPLSVVAELTYRCNLHCYCCYRKHCDTSAKKELSVSAWRRIFCELADAGTLYLTLTGGEPFMRGDILEIAAAAREKGFAVSMITNGTLITRPIARSLAKLGIMDIGVSLHAARRVLHDRLAGTPGSHALAINAIRLLKSAGFKVMIKHTVSKANFGEYRPLSDRAESLGCFFECDSLVMPDVARTVSPFTLSTVQQARFLRDMSAATVFKEKADSLHCDAGRSVAGITPAGDLLPCIQLPVRFGTMRRASFAMLWNGRRASKFRAQERRLLAECESCAKGNYCSRCHGLAMAESGDFRALSPSCCARAIAVKEHRVAAIAG